MKLLNILKHLSLSILLFISSCSFFDINPDDMLQEKDSYANTNEIYSTFLGLNTTLREAAEQSLIIGELMGDLLEPTNNAPDEFWDVWKYETKVNNTVANPVVFYNVIVNANDFLRHIVAFEDKNPGAIDSVSYRGMVSQAISNRVWAYLQLGKFYGEAVYYDWAISSEIDLSSQPVLKFDELIDELIHFMYNGVRGLDAFNALDWTNILNNTDYSWNRMYINPDALIGELFMWDGNYVEAAKNLALTLAGNGVIDNNGTSVRWLLGSLFQGSLWYSIFTSSFSGLVNEAVSAIPYDRTENQTNNLQYWFSNVSPNVYYFKPSDLSIDKFENNFTIGGYRGDVYRGSGVSYTTSNGENVVYKYSRGRTNYAHDASIFIYRAPELWLMLAEAMNGLGDFAAADSILNVGLASSWSGSALQAPFNTSVFTQNSNVLRSCLGVRGRANVQPNYLKNFVEDDALFERKHFVLDSLIAEEAGLEQAFEGKRWFFLMRMAKNSGIPEKVADQVAKKFPEGEREAYRTRMMNPENWFIKYDHLNVVEE